MCFSGSKASNRFLIHPHTGTKFYLVKCKHTHSLKQDVFLMFEVVAIGESHPVRNGPIKIKEEWMHWSVFGISTT